MDVYQAATTRRAIRRFKDKPIPYKAIERCVEAARLAPCGRNFQVCEYLVVDSAAGTTTMLDGIGGSLKMPPEKGGPRPEQYARAYILILINKSLEGDMDRRHLTHIDIGIAAENIMLAAFEQGIGTCPAMPSNEANLKHAFGIPDQYDVGLVIVMGYPDEQPVTDVAAALLSPYVDEKGVRHVPKRKLEDIIHRNKM